MTKPFLKTTTALVMAAGLATPAIAQTLADMKPREIVDGAESGTLDIGFDTTDMTRMEIRERIWIVQRQCRNGSAAKATNCDLVAQLPESLGIQPSDSQATQALNENPVTGGQTEQVVKDKPAKQRPASQQAGDARAAERRQIGNPVVDGQTESVADSAPVRNSAPRADDMTPGQMREALQNGQLGQGAAAAAEARRRVAEAQGAPAAQEPRKLTAQEQADALARANRQAAAAAATSGDEGEAKVVEEEVTESDVRRSDQDFSTRIGQNRQRQAQQQTQTARSGDDDDAGGLSNGEKAALLGLGAIALANILGDDSRVVENTGDRVVVEQDGQYRVLRNDDVLLRRPGSDIKTYRYDDGSTRTVVSYEDGNEVETIKAADGRVLRRTRTLPDGETIVLFDDTQASQEVVVNDLPQANEAPRRMNLREVNETDLAAALASQNVEQVDRTFSLNQIRNIDAVRHLVPEISVDSINFETGSAAIRPEEARELTTLGNAMKRIIAENPGEVFLIEGHTDAVGSWTYNLALSDRRAESVALALTEYFDVPPENMILQGYGESDLAIQTQTAERGNRRASVRRITPLLQGS